MFDVLCLMIVVWCQMIDVWCMVFDVWCLSSDVRRRMSNVWRQTIKTIHQTSCIHQSSDTSDIRLWDHILDFWHHPCDIRHETDIRCLTSDNKLQTSLTLDTNHHTPDIRHQTSDIRQQTSDITQTIIVIWKFLALEKVIYTWDYTGQCYNILSQIPKDWSSSGFQRLHTGIWNWKGRLAREPPGPFDFKRSRFWTRAP